MLFSLSWAALTPTSVPGPDSSLSSSLSSSESNSAPAASVGKPCDLACFISICSLTICSTTAVLDLCRLCFHEWKFQLRASLGKPSNLVAYPSARNSDIILCRLSVQQRVFVVGNSVRQAVQLDMLQQYLQPVYVQHNSCGRLVQSAVAPA